MKIKINVIIQLQIFVILLSICMYIYLCQRDGLAASAEESSAGPAPI